MSDRILFPEDFRWGAATSAYQIEGSPLADGAGPSIWHRFSHSPGHTSNGETGDVACDHYHRWRDDVALMHQLGLTAYRFSIAWGRVLPSGTGAKNPAGLDFYDRLVDTLLAHDIEPNVTLYHWDLPAALDERGGWLNRDIAGWFGEYVEACARRLGDRVAMWVTLNEPWVVADGGYLHGALAPGHRNVFEAPIAGQNLLRAHGTGVQALRASGASQVGLVVNLEPKYPASDSAADRAAARRADAYMNRQYLDPALLGRYPDELSEIFGEAWPEHSADDMQLIRQPLDFIGINYYTRGVMRDDPSALPVRVAYERQRHRTYTATGWEVFPDALTRVLLWVTERYGRMPLFITENGAAFYDPPKVENGQVPDPLRVSYLRQHLRAAHAALEGGVDLRGYFAWSLLDNYEWSLGFSKRFGIVHVDYETLERTPKASARFYADVIRTRGAALEAAEEPAALPVGE